ncbi:unnamed protein product, partial [Mesorhabditis belari]|uniref:Protein kinase domain-containing protein n=1 Tax=Mesorhabditis belari TaxID=2138241 RepID=A0AAF3F4S6_9BILA
MTQNVIEPWKQRTQDEYREIKLIGQGAYGAVYQVEHRATGQTVVTLWYRSPEVLLQTTYGSSVDVWAFGCILSEMYNRQTLFPGRTEADQLKIIVNKMGKPSESDWPSDAIIPLSFYEWTPRQSLYQLNPKLSQAACRFIEKCIRWNGDMRCTALEALNDSFFDGPYSQGYENLFDEPLPNAHQQ